jgi:hypothetical protein
MTAFTPPVQLPHAAGSAQFYQLSGLLGNATYFATVYIGDDVTVYSGLSNIGQIVTMAYPPALTGFWTASYNTPVVPLTNFNNSVVLGSFVSWVVLWLPMYFLFAWLVVKYREKVYERLKKTKLFQVLAASKLYNYYRMLFIG